MTAALRAGLGTLLVLALARLGRLFDLGWNRDHLALLAALSRIEPEGRDWMAAFIAAHLFARHDRSDAHASVQLEQLYHRMHFGTWDHG